MRLIHTKKAIDIVATKAPCHNVFELVKTLVIILYAIIDIKSLCIAGISLILIGVPGIPFSGGGQCAPTEPGRCMTFQTLALCLALAFECLQSLPCRNSNNENRACLASFQKLPSLVLKQGQVNTRRRVLPARPKKVVLTAVIKRAMWSATSS